MQNATEHKLNSVRDGRLDCPDQHIDEIRIEPNTDTLHWYTPPGRDRVVFVSMPPYSSWLLEIGNRQIPAYNLLNEQTVAFVPDDVSGPSRLVYQPNGYWMQLWISKAVWLLMLVGTSLMLALKWRRSSLGRSGT